LPAPASRASLALQPQGAAQLTRNEARCSVTIWRLRSLTGNTPSRGELGRRTEPVTLRWVLFHLVEETARHNGHIDILRELADGTRGI